MNELSTLFGVIADDRVTSSPQHHDAQDQVHDFILKRLPKSGQPLAAAAAHHFENPGKMLRAKMVMRGAYLLNVDRSAAIRWAAAIEILHNASLVHDDICDGF